MKLTNIVFRIQKKHIPEYYLGLWATYTRNCIEIPDYIYENLYKYGGMENSIALYLIGWFYKHNEDNHLIDIKNIEKVIVQGWDD